MTDYASFQLGGFSSPLTASTTNSLLQDADPALYYFTQFCKAVIGQHLGARWDAECTALGLSDLVGNIVSSTIPYDVVPMGQMAQYVLPLLAIFRLESDFKDTSTSWINRTSTWCLDWILKPLSPSQLERLWPMASAIEAVLTDRINNDGDPNVLGGATLASLMQTQSITLLQCRPSRSWVKTNVTPATGTSSTVLFPMMSMRFEVIERAKAITYPGWAGTDGIVSTSNGTTSVPIAPFSK